VSMGSVQRVAGLYAEQALAVLEKIRAAFEERGWPTTAPQDEGTDDYRWGFSIEPQCPFCGEVAYPRSADRTPERPHNPAQCPLCGEEGSWDAFGGLAVTLSMGLAFEYGDEPEDGITFRIDAVAEGGRILAQLAPYNYTPECWVSASDPEAVEERFALIAAVDPFEFMETVQGVMT